MKTFEEAKQYISETCHKYIKEPFEIRYNFKDTTYLGRCRQLAVPQIIFNVPYIKYCLEHNEVEEFKRTVLHEIGHVLAGAGHHHDKVWKEVCESIGLKNPQRLSKTTYRKPPKYKGVCPNCGKEYYYSRYNLYACKDCCDKYNNGKYSTKYLLDATEL